LQVIEAPFVLFGGAHLTVLAITLLLAVCLARIQVSEEVSQLARVLAVVLLVISLLKPLLYIGYYGRPWNTSLPLDLCRINEFFCVYMLWRRSFRTFEVAYFLAMAGSVSAMLMPDLAHGFPDPRFLTFFLSHSLSVLAVLYAVFGYGFRPTGQSLKVIILFLGGYTLFIALVNQVLDANYLFLQRKPAGASVLDYLGPWPWYVIALICIAVVACFVCYLPFAFRRPVNGAR
jgi:hypothetical integral membrane protein (TIGR02206 family)